MLDISLGEITLVLLIAMVFIGPERLPGVARKIGSFLRQVKEALFQVRQEVEQDEETAQVFSEMQNTVHEITNAVNLRKFMREMSEPLMEREIPSKAAAPKSHGWVGITSPPPPLTAEGENASSQDAAVQEQLPGDTPLQGTATGGLPERISPQHSPKGAHTLSTRHSPTASPLGSVVQKNSTTLEREFSQVDPE